MSTESFWGDLEFTELMETPVTILRRQAALVGEQTNWVIEGVVESRGSDDTFIYELSLVMPSLDNYMFKLLRVEHGISLYPLAIVRLCVDSGVYPCRNEQEYLTTLRELLSSTEVHSIIRALYSQSVAI